VQGRRYDLAKGEAVEYFDFLITKLLGVRIEIDFSEPWHRTGPVFCDPRLAPQRLGQSSFQAVVLDAYQRRCAITGSRIRPVLEAAHVLPVTRGGEHRTDNGLLLRSDIHKLYDDGYLGVDPKHRLLVSPRLRDEFGNGEQLYAIAGQPISVPARRGDRPNREFLERHLDEVYLRS
jgi:putative restriction endonuclease